MSATLKSGLLFGLAGVIAVIIVGFVPFIGTLLCGPFTALVVGGLAGYFARRWSDQPTGVGQSVLAAAIAGVGILIGTALLVIILYLLLRNSSEYPEIVNQITKQVLQQQPEANISEEDVQTMVSTAMPIAGFCFGVINLVIALVGGLVGGLLGNRATGTVTVIPPVPPAVPPIG